MEYAMPPVCGRSSIEFDEERAKDALHLTRVSLQWRTRKLVMVMHTHPDDRQKYPRNLFIQEVSYIPGTPRINQRTSSNARHVVADSDTWNSTSFDVPNGSIYCSDTAAITDVTKPRHMTSLSFENVSSSSSPNSTPPSGLPKATDTPAAAAAASSLRLRAEQRGISNRHRVTRVWAHLRSAGIA